MKNKTPSGWLLVVLAALGCSSRSEDKASSAEESTGATVSEGLTLAAPSLISVARTIPQLTASQTKVTEQGTLSVRVPIQLPPGAGNLTPSLALAYDSAGNTEGLAGIGWGLEGLSAITRCPRTPDQDGTWDPVHFATDDRLCLDGERLVAVTGAYGASSTEYRTELASFSKIVQTGSGATGAASFTVWTKAGLKMEYGTTPDSRVESNTTLTTGAVRTWALSKVTDPAGNYFTVTYAEDTATGEHLPTRIDYSGNARVPTAPELSVRFGYQKIFASDAVYTHPPKQCKSTLGDVCFTPERPATTTAFASDAASAGVNGCVTTIHNASSENPALYRGTYDLASRVGSDWYFYCYPANVATQNGTSRYVAGGSSRQTFRLAAVDSYVGASRARQWQLTYDTQGTGQRSRLTRIRECGWDGTCASPIELSWSTNNAMSFAAPTTWFTSNDNENLLTPVDLNGDGKSDLLQLRTGAAFATLSTGTSAPQLTQRATGLSPENVRISIGDFNGDGYPDLISFPAPAMVSLTETRAAADVWLGNGTGGFVAKGRWATGLSSDPRRLALGDVDGDNRIDLIEMAPNGTWKVYRSNGATAFALPVVYGSGHSNTVETFHVADVNADHRADVVEVVANTLRSWVTAGSTFTLRTNSLSDVGSDPKGFHLANLNGDAYPDVWRVIGGNLRVWMGTGAGFLASTIWAQGATAGTSLADLNGDGRADLASKRMFYQSGESVSSNAAVDYDMLFVRNNGSSFQGTSALSLLHGTATFREPVTQQAVYDYFGFRDPPDANGLPVAANYCSLKSLPKAANGLSDTYRNCVAPQACEICSDPNWYCDVSCGQIAATDFADMNGDGLADMVGFTELGEVRVALQQGAKPDLLVGVSDGLAIGAQKTATYKSASDTTVYTRETTTVARMVDLIPATPLVAALGTSDGRGGISQTTYSYSGARADVLGRGFLGFASMTVTEPSRTKTKTTYRQDYPYTGLPSVIERTSSTGVVLSKSQRLYATRAPSPGTILPYMTSDTVTAADLNRAVLPQVKTTQDVDINGNTTTHAVETSMGTAVQKVATTNTYDNDLVNWRLGKLRSATTVYTWSGKPSVTRRSTFDYFAATGQLKTEVIEPGVAAITKTTSYQYDLFGNRSSVTVAAGSNSRVTTFTYLANGRQLWKETNPKGQMAEYTYGEARLPEATSASNANGILTTVTFNSLGTKLSTLRSGVKETTSLDVCDTTRCPTFGKVLIHVDKAYEDRPGVFVAFAPRATTIVDALGRTVRTQTIGNAGVTIRADQEYDALGRLMRQTRPYFAVAAPVMAETRTQYDELGRAAVRTEPFGTGTVNTTFAYNGLTITTTNPLGQTSSETKNLVSKVASATQGTGADAKTTTFDYDATGRNTLTTDAIGRAHTSTYDVRGLQQSLTDPDLGTRTYEYNAFGEVTKVVNGKNQTTTMTYDPLGRLATRTEPEGITTYTYDTAVNGVGQLASITSPGGVRRNFEYDTLGRAKAVTVSVDAQVLRTETVYDKASRVSTVTYPSGAVVRYAYNNTIGQLSEMFVDSAPGITVSTSVWRANSRDAEGRVTQATYGNGLVGKSIFDTATGDLRERQVLSGSTIVDRETYTYDALHSIKSRANPISLASETFDYDSVNRLKTVTRGTSTTTMAYDAVGNLTSKSDVGAYTYAAGRLTSLPSGAVSYDGNGNVTAAEGRTVAYTSFDMPRTLAKGATSLAFTYDGEHRRVKQSGAPTGTVYYADPGTYEKIMSSTPEQQHFLRVGEQIVAQLSVKGSASTLSFTHNDALGSPVYVSSRSGAMLERLSWDPWGMRRLANGQPGPVTSALRRGYTGHEELDSVGLVHMNGRIYDPKIARFLSADPLVQSPTFSQNYARYSYVFDNPLAHTDPSGYRSLWRSLLGLFIGIVITIALPELAPAYFGGFWGGVAAGAIGGAIGGAISGGTAKSMLWGAVTGGVWGGIGDVLRGADLWLRVTAHGIVGGGLSLIQGGSPLQGMLSNGFGTMAGALDMEGLGSFEVVGKVTAAAVAGGTASVLSGGTFANGAESAAFGYLFNDVAHEFACSLVEVQRQELAERIRAARLAAPDLKQWGPLVDAIEPGPRHVEGMDLELLAIPLPVLKLSRYMPIAEIREAIKQIDGYTVQASVSAPRIRQYVEAFQRGMVPDTPIEIVDGVVWDGNHRYIASIIAGKTAPFVKRSSRNDFEVETIRDFARRIDSLKVDREKWDEWF